MFRLVTRSVAVAAILVLLAGCAPRGDGFAASLAERVIIGIGDDITPPYPKPQHAEGLAAKAIEAPRLPNLEAPVDYVIDVLSWAGHSGEPDCARILIRVDVHVEASSARSFGGESFTEGRSIRCWELTVFGFSDHDSLKTRELPCQEGATARVPELPSVPQEPVDLDARLAAVVADESIAAVDDRVRQEFPEEYFSVKSAEVDGELIVALGIPSELECAVAVRHEDGSVEVLRGWPTEQLQPGETGCDPGLYLAITTR